MNTAEWLPYLLDHGLYDIQFRREGVGLRFFEEQRARAAERPHDWNHVFSLENASDIEQGLVVYRYYPSLEEAIAGERQRLGGATKASWEKELSELEARVDVLKNAIKAQERPVYANVIHPHVREG